MEENDNERLILTNNLTFQSWQQCKIWFDSYGLQEAFSYNIRRSKSEEGILRRVMYECVKSGKHVPQISSEPTKRRNAPSQKINCPWHVNISYPTSSSVVKVNSFNNSHNHPMNSMIGEMAPQFQKFTEPMIADIRKYVINGWMDSAAIFPLLVHDYPSILSTSVISIIWYIVFATKIIQVKQMHQMLQTLFEWKEFDPRWIVKPRLESISRRLNSLLWMPPLQRDLYEQFIDVVCYKGRPPKRLKASVEQEHQKRKGVLQDSTNVNNSEINNEKDRRCGKCRKFGHYSMTCPN